MVMMTTTAFQQMCAGDRVCNIIILVFANILAYISKRHLSWSSLFILTAPYTALTHAHIHTKVKWMAENLKHFSFIQSDLKRELEREHLDNVHKV